MKKAVCVAIIKNGRILLVQKQRAWTLPGGKPKAKESDIQCLIREVGEELPTLSLKNIKYLGVFSGITPLRGDKLRAEVYLADADGKAVPNAEINAAEWTNEPGEYNLSDVTQKIIIALYDKGYL